MGGTCDVCGKLGGWLALGLIEAGTAALPGLKLDGGTGETKLPGASLELSASSEVIGSCDGS